MFDGLRLVHWKTDLRNDGVLVLSLDRADEKRERAVARGHRRALRDARAHRAGVAQGRGAPFRQAAGIPGADIKGFEAIEAKGQTEDWIRLGQLMFQRLAELRCPTVAIIHGICLGGGTELALACRYRVASDDPSTRIGLPEVKLGIYPGWGGSVRLPALVGAPAAMDMMLTGRNLSPPRRRRSAWSTAWSILRAAGVRDRPDPARPQAALRPALQAWATNTWLARQLLAPQMAKQVARKARKEHYPPRTADRDLAPQRRPGHARRAEGGGALGGRAGEDARPRATWCACSS
jgi:3-hydroxyacyl-CoA dehydrogenase/enoyl-CoA hydratase/3-hydroxybutyryl-CoA epimerase